MTATNPIDRPRIVSESLNRAIARLTEARQVTILARRQAEELAQKESERLLPAISLARLRVNDLLPIMSEETYEVRQAYRQEWDQLFGFLRNEDALPKGMIQFRLRELQEEMESATSFGKFQDFMAYINEVHELWELLQEKAFPE